MEHGFRFTKKQLQSLTGKLQFASSCIRPGRIFISRMYDTIGTLDDDKWYSMRAELKRDILWWKVFIQQYNGASIMWMIQKKEVDQLIATDSCLVGIGGTCGDRYFHMTLPEWVRQVENVNIAHFELWAILVAIRLWKNYITGHRFVVGCNNQAVATIINTGRAKNGLLQTLLRELTFEVAMAQAEIYAKFVPGWENLLPDILSRWTLNDEYRRKFLQEKQPHWQEDHVHPELFLIHDYW